MTTHQPFGVKAGMVRIPGRLVLFIIPVWLTWLATPACRPTDEEPPSNTPAPDVLAEMQNIPGSEFLMGSDQADASIFFDEKALYLTEPLTLSIKPFRIDRLEVTNKKYDQCVEAGWCAASPFRRDEGFDAPAQPVIGVTWEQADRYCRWRGLRLPTESEWEFAARSGAVGQPRSDPAPAAWHAENSNGATHPVGAKAPNAAGLYDMLGNVWEWCDNWYEYPPRNWSPAAWKDLRAPALFVEEQFRAIRGAGWGTPASQVSPTLRFWARPDFYSSALGFRCAVDADE